MSCVVCVDNGEYTYIIRINLCDNKFADVWLLCKVHSCTSSSHVLSCTSVCLPYLAVVLELSELYCSLAKEHHGQITLQVCQLEGWAKCVFFFPLLSSKQETLLLHLNKWVTVLSVMYYCNFFFFFFFANGSHVHSLNTQEFLQRPGKANSLSKTSPVYNGHTHCSEIFTKTVIWLAHIWYLCPLRRNKEAINCMKTSIAWSHTLSCSNKSSCISCMQIIYIWVFSSLVPGWQFH